MLFSYILCLSVLSVGQLSSIKAETSDSFAGHWYVWEENVNVSGNQWISYQNVLIVTNDPLAMGQVQVNNTTSGLNNFVQTLDFAGTYTFYSHRFEQPFTLSNGLMPVATSNSRAFTSYTPIQSAHNVEVVQLSSTQIQSLITAINNSSSYDDTDLLNILAVINGVLDNIDTATTVTASDIAALNTTASNIYTALQNIDNAIDMISWLDTLYRYQGYSTTIDGTYDSDTSNLTVNNTDIYFNIKKNSSTTNLISYNSIIRIILPWYLNVDRLDYVEVKLTSNGGTIPCSYYVNPGYMRTDLYLYDFYTSSNPYDIIIHFHFLRSSSMYRRAVVNFDASYITSDDIEYWQLRQALALLSAQRNQETIIINQQNQNNYQQQPYDNENNTDETDEINGFIVDYDNKLGFIGQTFDFIGSLFGVITSADESETIPFPGVTVPIGENGSNVTLLAAQNVPIVPQGLSSIFDTVKLANSMILVCAVFNMAISKYKEWSMK